MNRGEAELIVDGLHQSGERLFQSVVVGLAVLLHLSLRIHVNANLGYQEQLSLRSVRTMEEIEHAELERETQGEDRCVVKEESLLLDRICPGANRPEREDHDLLRGKRRSAVPWSLCSGLLPTDTFTWESVEM